ncbi:MAG TPA: glycoside hydrolase family 43 protein [Polyangia bacterium]|nr:glycoside hydrolase family 43 protein [Polyangia bacterium]
MSMRVFVFGAVVLLSVLISSRASADYPVMSHRYLADPGSLVYNGQVYLYNSNDDDNAVGGGYTMHSAVCVSSSDMKNWTDHGVVFQVPADASWAQNSWAPQPIQRDGTIYLYFGNSGSGVGVASSTDPAGVFKDAKGSYLVDGSTPGASGSNSWLFDPGALIDDDGQAYLSFGGNGMTNARIIKLGTDLKSVSGSAAALAPNGFFEASFLFKRNSIYYFAYSTDSANGLRIDYMTSSSPMSGYTYRGTVAGQPPVNNNNNHASEFLFNGQWYHAYHNRYVSTQAGISTTYKRNLGIEVLNFNTDGTIKQVTYTTDGVPQVGTLDPYVRVEAETMNAQSGIETETCSEGGMDVTQISNGDWTRVRGVNFGTAGAKTFSARVASTSSGGSIELHLGSLTGTLVGTCSVPSTGGAQTWMTTTCNVSGATGVADLYFKFTGSGTSLFNFDYWQFTGGAGGSGGAPGAGGAQGTGGSSGSGGVGGSGTGGVTATGGVTGTGGIAGTGGSTGTGGTVATGGATGTGGVVATGGAPGAGGVVGSGGATTTGGVTGTGGHSPTGTGGAAQSESAGGCSCDVTGRGGSGWFAIALGLLVLQRRSRRDELARRRR